MLRPATRMLAAAAFALGLAPGLTAAPAKAQEFINVLTGGTSGVYYPLGVALSEIYGEKIEGARAQVQATKASVENLNLLQQGKGEIAFALGDSVKLGWEGDTEAGFPGKLDKLRGIAATHSDVSDEIAYQMTKQLFENLDRLTAAHAAAKAITLDGALTGMPVPLHPGAERYYKEKGLIK